MRAVHRAHRIWNATIPADQTPGSAYLIENRWCWPPQELDCPLPEDVRWLPLANVASQRFPDQGPPGPWSSPSASGIAPSRLFTSKPSAADGARVPWPPNQSDGKPHPRKTIGRLAGAYFRIPARKPDSLSRPGNLPCGGDPGRGGGRCLGRILGLAWQ